MSYRRPHAVRPLLPLVLGLLSTAARSAPSETQHLAVGERAVIPLQRANAEVNTNCAADVVKIFRNEASGTLELEASRSGSCWVRVDGRQLNLVVADSSSQQVNCAQIKDVLRRTGLSVSCHDAMTYISGTPVDEESNALASSVAASYPGVILDIVPRSRPEVQFDVVFLERRRQRGDDIGLDLATALPAVLANAANAMDEDGALGYGVLTPLADNLTLQAVISRYEVMEKRTVSAVLGEPAVIAAGGRAYYKISGVGSADLKEVPYGLHATMKAEARSQGYEVNLDILVSEPVPGGTSADIELAERSVTTTVNLSNSDLVVVATGDSNRVWWRDSGIPLLHRIPVIGSFFGRDQNAHQPVQSAVLIAAHEPGESPPWMGQLSTLQQRLEEP